MLIDNRAACDYVLYEPFTLGWAGDVGEAEITYRKDAADNDRLLDNHVGLSSCNTALTFWLGAEALYGDDNNDEKEDTHFCEDDSYGEDFWDDDPREGDAP